MRKLFAVAAVPVVGIAWFVLGASPASAGGWAISSLDAVPAPVAGDTIQVGFTILQHGVTPVTEETMDGTEVAVGVRSADGEETFAARPAGPTGHYVADVTFPAGNGVTWWIEQGWFGRYELGPVDVAPVPAAVEPATSNDGRSLVTPWPIRVLLPVAALVGLGLVADDLRRRRFPAQA